MLPATCTEESCRGHRYWTLACPRSHTIATAKERMPGFHVPSKAKKARVIQLLRRAERGLLSYDAYGKDTLQGFAKARGLHNALKKKATRADLIVLLEKADEEATFDRFMDFPPELRVRIYELHFQSFEPLAADMNAMPWQYHVNLAQAPITRVCKAVRQDALTLFFEQMRFELLFFCGPRHGLDTSQKVTREFIGLNMLHRSSGEYLAKIRRLHLTVMPSYQNHDGLSFVLDFVKGTVIHPVSDVAGIHYEIATVVEAGRAIESIVSEVAARTGKHNFRRHDRDRLVKAMEQIVQKP